MGVGAREREARLIFHCVSVPLQVLHPGRSITKSDYLPVTHPQVSSVLLGGQGHLWGQLYMVWNCEGVVPTTSLLPPGK